MKKKTAVGIVLALALAAQSATAFAAGSAGSDDSEVTYEDTVSNTTVTVNEDGVKVTGTVTSGDSADGSSIAIAVQTTTESGQTIRTNSSGEAVVGDKVLSFAKNAAATAGLPDNIVQEIGEINGGTSLSLIITSGFDLTLEPHRVSRNHLDLNNAPRLNMTGYYALTGTHALVTKNASTGRVDDTPTEAVIYVPNLVDGLQNISVLYYNNATGHWLLLPVSRVDMNSKLVYVNVTGSGTLSVVYKR